MNTTMIKIGNGTNNHNYHTLRILIDIKVRYYYMKHALFPVILRVYIL